MIGPCRLGNNRVSFDYCTSREILENMIKGYVEVTKNPSPGASACGPAGEPCAGALSVSSGVAFVPDETIDIDTAIPEGHLSADEIRERMACRHDVIEQTYRVLKKLRLPKVLAEQVLNAIGLYNDGILDNFLFSSLVELRPYLGRIIRYLLAMANNPPSGPVFLRVAPSIGTLVHNFAIGWRNRFHGGWRLGELTDFNLEFKGGVQQLLSAFQAAYRLMSWAFMLDDEVLAIVTGEPGISVELGALKLSFQDIFKPAFFASRVGHETSEQMLELDFRSQFQRVRPVMRIWELSYVYSQIPRERVETLHDVGVGLRQVLEKLASITEPPSKSDVKEAIEYFDRLVLWHNAVSQIYRELCPEYGQDPIGRLQALNQGDRNSLLRKVGVFCCQLRDVLLAGLDPVIHKAAQEFSSAEQPDFFTSLSHNDPAAWEVVANLVHAVKDAVLNNAVRIKGLLEILRTPAEGTNTGLFAILENWQQNLEREWEPIRKQIERLVSLQWPLGWIPPLRRMMRIAKAKEPRLRLLVDETEPRFFDQVFADICNFVIVFGGDEELYSYRSLGSFVVTPECWDSQGHVIVERLWEALVRLFLALGVNGTTQ